MLLNNKKGKGFWWNLGEEGAGGGKIRYTNCVENCRWGGENLRGCINFKKYCI